MIISSQPDNQPSPFSSFMAPKFRSSFESAHDSLQIEKKNQFWTEIIIFPQYQLHGLLYLENSQATSNATYFL